MSKKRIGAIELKSSIDAMLRKYGEEVRDIVPIVTEEVLADATRELKHAGDFGGKDYRKGWTYDVDNKKFRVDGVVYNATEYQLTHLLEYGHAVMRGGRKIGEAGAHEHIYPVNEKAQTEFEKKLIEYIGRGGV